MRKYVTVLMPSNNCYPALPNISLKDMRRILKFEFLDDAIDECERLLENGYTRSGDWSLAQICCHLRLTIEHNMGGYPTWMKILGYPLRPILRRFMLPRLLAGNSPNGIRTPGVFVPPDNGIDEDEVDQFRRCIEKFMSSNGPMHAHPGFGKMSNEKFNRFHAAHAAHHLSFLHPLELAG